MEKNLERKVSTVLKRSRYLRFDESIKFKAMEKVAVSSYINDLYPCIKIEPDKQVVVYWGDIRRRNSYLEVYIVILSDSDRFLTVLRQGAVEYQTRI